MANDGLNINSYMEPISSFVLFTRAGSFSGFIKDFYCGPIDSPFTKPGSQRATFVHMPTNSALFSASGVGMVIIHIFVKN